MYGNGVKITGSKPIEELLLTVLLGFLRAKRMFIVCFVVAVGAMIQMKVVSLDGTPLHLNINSAISASASPYLPVNWGATRLLMQSKTLGDIPSYNLQSLFNIHQSHPSRPATAIAALALIGARPAPPALSIAARTAVGIVEDIHNILAHIDQGGYQEKGDDDTWDHGKRIKNGK